MNRRSFLRLSLASAVATVIRPVMPAVADILEDKPSFVDSINLDWLGELTIQSLKEDILYENALFLKLRSGELQTFDGGKKIMEPLRYD